jgi:hypothetical protein
MQFPESIDINGRVYFRRAEIVNWRPPEKAPRTTAPRFKKSAPVADQQHP